MKAEARLRGDIETRAFLPREVSTRRSCPATLLDAQPFSSGFSRVTTDFSCILNFLRSRFPSSARVVFPKFYLAVAASVPPSNNYYFNALCLVKRKSLELAVRYYSDFSFDEFVRIRNSLSHALWLIHTCNTFLRILQKSKTYFK